MRKNEILVPGRHLVRFPWRWEKPGKSQKNGIPNLIKLCLKCAVKLLNKFAFKTSLDFIFVFLANKR